MYRMIGLKRKLSFLFLIFFFILLLQQVGYSETKEINLEKQIETWLQQLTKTSPYQERLDLLNLKQIVIKPMNEDVQIITFSTDEQQQGYIVVTKDDNKMKVVEYGLGSILPYQKQVIADEGIKEMIPKEFTYHSPFENYWFFDTKNENIYIEGSTGEWLPDLSAYQPEYRQTNGLDLKEKLTDSLFNDKLIFNPYEDLTWLLNNENNLSITKNQLILSLKQKQEVLFVGSKYDRQVQFAFPVIGYQSWDDQNYITLYDETLDLIRYVPFKDAQAFGTFYLHP
ncbi:hypothetical protein [Tepidibacillus sp. HK-1]|uniref:hypothetical protein n=1 Tax=Tepidibacillus sp. HK-1 TaxID=1883407 RepID=UPI0008530226|nr:hypothetical protein [Tepidibacillus sp. HK-1]GBF10997.1 hypothetical protein HK1_01015 [Tepidibacillus sp. HK-1]